MYGRKKLKTFVLDSSPTMPLLNAYAAFEIMDKMEARINELEDIIKVDDAIRITRLENENEHLKQLVKSLEDAHEELSVCNQKNVSELVHLKERNRELEATIAKHEGAPCKHCISIPGQEALAKDEYNTLYLDNDILRFSSREGEDDYVLETRINFCPICGMELEHED